MYKIYKLIYKGDIVYIGRTKRSLEARKKDGYKNTCVEHIYKECSIELIEETDDSSRERYWINHYSDIILNIRKGDGFILKDWAKDKYDNDKEYNESRRLQSKSYFERNKDLIRQKARENYQKNREQRLAQKAEYRKKVKENNEEKVLIK